jgi:hypothetical protein
MKNDFGFIEFEDLENYGITAGTPEVGAVIAEVPEKSRKGRKKKEISVEQGQVEEPEVMDGPEPGDGAVFAEVSEDSRITRPAPYEEEKQDPSPERPYVMARWKSKPMWQCRKCPWNTLKGEAVMLEHVDKVHGEKKPAPVARPRVIVVYDKYGREKG